MVETVFLEVLGKIIAISVVICSCGVVLSRRDKQCPHCKKQRLDK